MKLNVINALRQIGEVYSAVLEMKIDNAAGFDTTGPLHVELKYSYDGNKLTIFGNARIGIKGCCDRCLKDITSGINFDFKEDFYKLEDAPDDEAYTFEKNFVDLEQPMLNLIELNAPMKFLCKEDCKGLCKICGHDLNEGDCAHVLKD